MDLKVTCFGEILWDILPRGTVPGGAPMNVAYHLHRLNASPALITRVGNDQRGEELKTILREKHVDIRLLQTDYQYPTGLVYGIADINGDMKYEIVAPSAWDFIQPEPTAAATVAASDYFVFGSLAARNDVSRNTLFALLEVAKTKVLDVNLRPPFFNQDLVEQLLKKADMVKLNIDEFELLCNWWLPAGDLSQRAALLLRQFELDTLIITRGAEGAAVWHNNKLYEHPGYKVKVADTVGSGDSFLAGFLHQRLNGSTITDALTYACALGALVASKSGAWPEYELAEIDALINL